MIALRNALARPVLVVEMTGKLPYVTSLLVDFRGTFESSVRMTKFVQLHEAEV